MGEPIIIDCDPGHDDAIALVMACALDQLTIKAITTCAGNQTLDKTLYNARRILTLLNRHDIPVAGGAHKPLLRDLVVANNVHGESGLDGPELPAPAMDAQPDNAISVMARVLEASHQPITVVATGPLTNVALLLATYPHLANRIKRIVLMGGGATLGNWTPAAEFNIYVDPEAAHRVFHSGIPITMFGLDVTHQALVKDADVATIRAIDNPVAQTVAGWLEFFMRYHRDPKWQLDGSPLHDPCTIAWLIKPELFDCESVWVDIETQGKLTTGMTVVDRYRVTGHAANADVAMKINREGFISLLCDCLTQYSQ
ncbi:MULTISPECIES: pyrimidine-specific ribonucleoside hydrolase RihA [unclassified Salinivibrio]|uniref:pyrimidine-specific ribonucleoside hydrolase RihA n=1 Tax=unclassified Salinivibrio TaxID=2636825 RepID=UPI000986D390|nr:MULTISPECIES: pyrimidine-specific ribonucleoside hydrolase RihA [unclassified Salinivibrio]OOF14752.1 pyrimidine-specific ribonucleoside hydrolase RihA [Salinivibrio sp. PR919]OOF17582.1 pyrimidine-specific ribonucleoside hydrolase RihA [Salinivibrio sp. PR932]